MATTYYFLPTRNLFGEDSVQEAGTLMQSLGGKKAMIVTDSFLASSGMAADIQEILKKAGVDSVVFGGAEPNPKDTNVVSGLEMFRSEGCDSIISLGGGSSHDCAKAIGLVASNGGDIRDYEGVDKSTKPMCPMIAINTTAGTASEITRFCIITDTSRHVKMAIVDWRVKYCSGSFQSNILPNTFAQAWLMPGFVLFSRSRYFEEEYPWVFTL